MHITRITGPIEADVPQDGGRWALYCEHLTNGEWLVAGLIQDTNKRRLAQWSDARLADGYTEWCPECQLNFESDSGSKK